MSTLVTGGSGKLGRELQKVFPKALFPTRKELDITLAKRVSSFFAKTRPKIVIHTAAMTGIRECEENKNLVWETNVVGTKNLIEASLKLKTPPYFIYISTACVFWRDRRDKSMYKENDIPYPKNFYSLTKLLGEMAVQESSLKKWLIIRTNFVPKAPWPYPAAFADRFGTYLFADDVAKGIKELTGAEMTEVVHLTGDKKMSIYKLAKMVSPNVKPITLKDYKGPQLTIDMSLDSKRWKKYKISKP